MEIKTANCPACGGSISFDVERFTCPYCQQQLYVADGGLTPLFSSLTDTTAQVRDELLLKRYEKELGRMLDERMMGVGNTGLLMIATFIVPFLLVAYFGDMVKLPFELLMALAVAAGILCTVPAAIDFDKRKAKVDARIAELKENIRRLS
jgi:hypothetical protein